MVRTHRPLGVVLSLNSKHKQVHTFNFSKGQVRPKIRVETKVHRHTGTFERHGTRSPSSWTGMGTGTTDGIEILPTFLVPSSIYPDKQFSSVVSLLPSTGGRTHPGKTPCHGTDVIGTHLLRTNTDYLKSVTQRNYDVLTERTTG